MVSLVPDCRRISQPFDSFQIRRQARDDSCVAACAVAIVRHCSGPDVDEEALSDAITLPDAGSQYRQLANQLPEHAPGWFVLVEPFSDREEFEGRLRTLHGGAGAVLVALRLEQSGGEMLHSVVVTEVKAESAVVHDPADGSSSEPALSTLRERSTKELAVLLAPYDYRSLAEATNATHLERSGLTVDAAQAGVQALERHLPAGWLTRAARHPLRTWLYRSAITVGTFGIQIGRDIAILEKRGVANVQDVAAGLFIDGNDQSGRDRTYEGFNHSRAVLAAAARLASAGLSVQLEPPAAPGVARHADIRVEGPSGHACIEVKSQQSKIHEKRILEAESKFGIHFRPPNGAYEIAIEPELARRWAGLDDDAVRKASVRLVAEAATDAAAAAARGRHREQWYDANFGLSVRWHGEHDGVQHSLNYGGREVAWVPDDSPFIKRLLDKRVAEQLPRDEPGFVIAEFLGLRCNIQYLDLLFLSVTVAHQPDWRHVAGIIYCRAMHGPDRAYGLIENPHRGVDLPWWLVPALNRPPPD